MQSDIVRFTLIYTLLVGFWLVSASASAHESPEHRIKQLDDQLDQMEPHPSIESIKFMLQRADLNRRRGAWDSALFDYERIAEQQPENADMLLGRSRTYLGKEQFDEADFRATRLLQLQPEHAHAGLVQARALVGMGDHLAASGVFERAIQRLRTPLPEHYLEHARTVLGTENQDSVDNSLLAISILDKGAAHLGNPVSLHSFALEIERQAGELEAALRRIDMLIARNGSLLNWRLQRAELLLEMKRDRAARKELDNTLQQIGQLPDQRRHSRAIQTTTQHALQLKARIGR